ncbi:MAG TPA: FCD domain-containing protein [Beijerinckiaceae bacterium]|jgi:DNA-binding GntR family transcriptional regulator
MDNRKALDAIELRRTQSLTAIVSKELERMILGGELKAGERLNEQVLASRLGVSRGPVREATRALERAGLVTVVPNQGVFVRQIGFDEAIEIYDVRAVVFGFACERLARAISAEQQAELADLVAQMGEAIERGDSPTYYRLNLSFHDTMMSFAGHGRAKQVYDSLINETHLFRQRALGTKDSMRESNGEHVAILDAIAAGDGARARKLGEEHSLSGKRRWLEALGR